MLRTASCSAFSRCPSTYGTPFSPSLTGGSPEEANQRCRDDATPSPTALERGSPTSSSSLTTDATWAGVGRGISHKDSTKRRQSIMPLAGRSNKATKLVSWLGRSASHECGRARDPARAAACWRVRTASSTEIMAVGAAPRSMGISAASWYVDSRRGLSTSLGSGGGGGGGGVTQSFSIASAIAAFSASSMPTSVGLSADPSSTSPSGAASTASVKTVRALCGSGTSSSRSAPATPLYQSLATFAVVWNRTVSWCTRLANNDANAFMWSATNVSSTTDVLSCSAASRASSHLVHKASRKSSARQWRWPLVASSARNSMSTALNST
mmetsp:Transcript_16877/g.33273  ORF Transcript_16877/g.33273 Transcript_16877/m.33273 type:complete len:325 (-) Transcript_16877:250-1224(-)